MIAPLVTVVDERRQIGSTRDRRRSGTGTGDLAPTPARKAGQSQPDEARNQRPVEPAARRKEGAPDGVQNGPLRFTDEFVRRQDVQDKK